MDLCDIREIRQIMNVFHLNFRKEFGQNFLTDRSVVEDIAALCCDRGQEDSTILEIGPGIGTLSRELAERYRRVIALEIDTGLIPVLKYTMGSYPNFTVINQDVMKADLDALLSDAFAQGNVSVCANLPYYITTPILMKLLESSCPFDSITVMVQKEVADRLCARAGSRDCGAITAVVAYYGEAQELFTVKADRFVPAPKVDSAVVRIKLYKQKPYRPKSEEMLFRTIRAAFEQRRKTLPNSLCTGFGELSKETLCAVVERCGHRSDIRGERLSIADFVALSDALGDEIAAQKEQKK
jgi:16S rRNA (adenine1518-N6/adenine1519-N6)-dimethyltransferase